MQITHFNPARGPLGTIVTIQLTGVPAGANSANTRVGGLGGAGNVELVSVQVQPGGQGTVTGRVGPMAMTGRLTVYVDDGNHEEFAVAANQFQVP